MVSLAIQPGQTRALADDRERMTRRVVPGRGWSTTAVREESEPWTFLERVPEPATLRVMDLARVAGDLFHPRQASQDVSETTGNLT